MGYETGDRFEEEIDGYTYTCVVLVSTPEELKIMKVNKATGAIRYDVYRPNFRYNKQHSHEFMDNGKYGVHFPEATSGDKKRFGSMTKSLDNKNTDDDNK